MDNGNSFFEELLQLEGCESDKRRFRFFSIWCKLPLMLRRTILLILITLVLLAIACLL